MKFLITGANGFLGKSILCDSRFNDNFTISRNQLKFCDLNKSIGNLSEDDIDLINEFQPEVVINTAWSGINNYSLHQTLENITNHLKFIDKTCSIKSIKKFINFGSAWECDRLNGVAYEADYFQSNSDFLLAKKIIYEYSNLRYGDKHLWLRMFYVFGVNQMKGLVRYVAKNIVRNLPIELKNPNSVLDYISISDVTNYIYNFSTKDIPNGIFNLGSGKGIKNNELLKIILAVAYDLGLCYNNNIIINNNKFEDYFWASMEKTNNYIKNIHLNYNFTNDIKDILLYEKQEYCNFKNST